MASFASRISDRSFHGAKEALASPSWSLRHSRSLLTNIIIPSLFLCHAATALPSALQRKADSSKAPATITATDDDTPSTAPTLSTYLPAQIGGIVGSYALSLVIVAIALLILSKRRREHLSAGENETEFLQNVDKPQAAVVVQEERVYAWPPTSPRSIPRSPVILNGDAGYASIDSPLAYTPQTPRLPEHQTYVFPASPTSTIRSPLGVDHTVDQRIVAADRVMAQTRLEDMYKYVLEHEEAKLNGVEAPPERARPAQLNLGAGAGEEKRQSKASSLFSSLMSPRRSKMKGVSISSPIMTPMSGTFPATCLAPDPGSLPDGTQSIDERIGVAAMEGRTHTRNVSFAPTEAEPESAVSTHSQSPLGPNDFTYPLEPQARFELLAAQRPHGREDGWIVAPPCLRKPLGLPRSTNASTKQTVFERTGPLSPSGAMTPFTGMAVPYSPYQPYTPCVPMTPSLVTKADRKRMKRLEPKTPTVEMVKSSEDIW
ncbi:unnamed protein product [Parascedosporium putredinis]|uniref:Uncharacterized protein n=1 Tax=Parascedosporium putredinis TaxID=1442378 RepID=A0A9P1MFC0_9PEZI|nr:unnamed protein product [Parascedosporium putredinis]CAI8004735.1 unnamed protein product [Parascedosporium putredinis]